MNAARPRAAGHYALRMCLIALLGLAVPRFAIFLMWIFTNRLTVAFNSFVLGFVGFLVLPFTTLFYALAYTPIFGVSGFGWILVAFGFLLDMSSYGSSGREGRNRRRA